MPPFMLSLPPFILEGFSLTFFIVSLPTPVILVLPIFDSLYFSASVFPLVIFDFMIHLLS